MFYMHYATKVVGMVQKIGLSCVVRMSRCSSVEFKVITINKRYDNVVCVNIDIEQVHSYRECPAIRHRCTVTDDDERQLNTGDRDNRAVVAELTDYDMTMTRLAAYLLAAHEKHRNTLLSGNDGRLKTPKLKLMLRYIQAMLACGIPRDVAEMHKVLSYFRIPLRHNNGVLNVAEALRLEGLLLLRSGDALVMPRLQLLLNQRQTDGTYFIPDHGANVLHDPVSGTLRAVRLLLLARNRPSIKALIDEDALRVSLDKVYPLVKKRERDVAQVLRLYFDLNHHLSDEQQRLLKGLLSKAQTGGGLWGLSKTNQAEDLIVAIHQRRLPARYTLRPSADTDDLRTPDDIIDDMRNIIVTTCSIVDHLAPLRRAYTPVADALEQGMTLWWELFAGKDAPLIMQTIFPDEHEFLTIMCLTMIAASAYTGEVLKERAWLAELRSQAKTFSGASEKQWVAEALRHWLEVDIQNEHRLELGLSGSNVMRFTPYIALHKLWALPVEHLSLIVKYGRREEIEAERRNYQMIPPSIRRHFVRLPDKSYDNQQGMTFVIMEDLTDYVTVFEAYERLVQSNEKRFSRALMKVLREVHGQPSNPRTSTPRHLRELYLLPMLAESEQIVGMAEYIRRRGKPDRLSTQDFQQIDEMLRSLIRPINELTYFPLAFMHGDLHTRNIMVMSTRQGRRDYTFKLIDLEKMRVEGDMAHDAGQLLADLDFLTVNAERPLSGSAVQLRDHLLEAYQRYAKERQDTHFNLRLELAMARAYMRITKGRFKRALRHLDNREYTDADTVIYNTIGLIESTRDTLKRLITMLE